MLSISLYLVFVVFLPLFHHVFLHSGRYSKLQHETRVYCTTCLALNLFEMTTQQDKFTNHAKSEFGSFCFLCYQCSGTLPLLKKRKIMATCRKSHMNLTKFQNFSAPRVYASGVFGGSTLKNRNAVWNNKNKKEFSGIRLSTGGFPFIIHDFFDLK